MNQPARNVQSLADDLLERKISDKNRDFLSERSPVRKKQLLRELETLLKQRSDAQVAKMERAQGLA